MLQKYFDIHQEKISNDFLHLEVGAAHVALTAFDENNAASRNFELYTFDKNDDFENVLLQIYTQSSFLKQEFQSVKIIWENPYAQYIPKDFYNDSVEDIIYYFTEQKLTPQKRLLQKNDLFAVPFSVDEDKWNSLHKKFPNAEDAHKYYEIIRHLSTAKNTVPLHLLVIFYPNHFIISANKNGQLQLINSVNFSSETDVVYYLLNAAKQLGVSISETSVILSGLIDGDSNLFREIYKYVPNIDVDTADNAIFLKENFSEHPSHFFVPFFKYA